MIKQVLDKLIENGLTIAFAESITGGGLVHGLIMHENASKIIKGSIVAYSTETKIKVLKVNKITIEKYGVVSKQISYEMAKETQKIFSSDLAVATTGNAGPTFLDNKNKQEVFFTIIFIKDHYHYHLTFDNETRENVINKTIAIVYEKIYELLINK